MTWEKIEYEELRKFELGIEANLQTTETELNKHCPFYEADCYKAVLDEHDLDRVFVCTTSDFETYTGNSFKLKLVNETARADSIVADLLEKNIDLSESHRWGPLFITPSLEGPLVALDGNHRLLAHYLRHGNISGLRAFLYVHINSVRWPWFPDAAREMSK